MTNNKFLIILLFLLFSFIVNAQQKSQSGAYYDYQVRCQGIEMDGSQTLEAFGKGRNYRDASEQAKKNAVYSVIFKGIKEGNGGCNRDPLLLSSSPEIKYEEYFARFFADGGPYLEFVSLEDERISKKLKRDAKKSKNVQQRMVIVRVDRLGLKMRLKSDNIQ